MRIGIDTVFVSEHAIDQMPKLDQLTIVRNLVRKGFRAHDQDADGERVTEIEVEAVWLDGDMETLVFDRLVGFPLTPERDWYGDWKKDTCG